MSEIELKPASVFECFAKVNQVPRPSKREEKMIEFLLSFGHSLGIDIHESPSASPSETAVLPAGAVISAEPGIYLPGRFGVRIEDVLILKEGGCEDITRSPKDLIVL